MAPAPAGSPEITAGVGFSATEQRLFYGTLGLLVAAMVLVPLPALDRWLPARTLVLELGGITLATWAALRGEWRGTRVRAALLRPTNAAVLLFLGWLAFAAARSPFPRLAGYELMRILGTVLTAGAVLYAVPSRAVGRPVGTLSVVLALASLVALNGFGNSAVKGPPTSLGAFGNGQLLAGALCPVFPLMLSAAWADDRSWRRVAAQVGTVMLGAALIVSANRSVWLGTAAGLVLLFALNQWSSGAAWRLPDRRRWVVPALTVLAAVTLFFALSYQAGAFVQRVGTLTQHRSDASFAWRQQMWGIGLEMVRERPWTGWGLGSFPVQQALFNPDSREQWEILAGGATLSESAHNSYVTLAVETGIPGLALYLGVLLAFAGTALAALTRMRGAGRGRRRAFLAGAVAGVAAQAICAAGCPVWEYPECSLFLWLTLALGLAAAGEGERGSDLPVGAGHAAPDLEAIR
jgi:O-antigen ligase